MLRPRIIPCLLIHNKGLIKSIGFKNYKYVGDPINTVRIFNEKEVDELIILDIDATVQSKEPDYRMIENIAAECRMPLCYGGGIKTKQHAQNIFSLGVEKIALSSAVINNLNILKEISDQVGLQSVVVVIDIKRNILGNLDIFINNGKLKVKIDPNKFIENILKIGVGEIVINSINQDGKMNGYDFNMIDKCIKNIDVPVTIMGGAGYFDHILDAIKRYGILGVASGSMFVFKGKYRAVLINYPSKSEKQKILEV